MPRVVPNRLQLKENNNKKNRVDHQPPTTWGEKSKFKCSLSLFVEQTEVKVDLSAAVQFAEAAAPIIYDSEGSSCCGGGAEREQKACPTTEWADHSLKEWMDSGTVVPGFLCVVSPRSIPSRASARTHHSQSCRHALTLLSKKQGLNLYCGWSTSALTYWLSSGVRVGPGAGTLVAFGVCCESNRWEVWEQACFSSTWQLLPYILFFHHHTRSGKHCSDLFKSRKMTLFFNLYKW